MKGTRRLSEKQGRHRILLTWICSLLILPYYIYTRTVHTLFFVLGTYIYIHTYLPSLSLKVGI